jgi:SAM-dependent methyltransferase
METAKKPPSRAVRSVMSQFGRPRGLLGRVVGLILANRPGNLRRNRFTVEKLALKDGERVLEIGCGPGVALKLCLNSGPSVSCAGLDHSEAMIAMSRSRNRGDVKSGRLHLVLGGPEHLEFAGAGFDKVMMINVAMFVSDRASLFADLKRRMASPGRIVVTHEPRNPGATDADGEAFAAKLSGELAAAGFANIRKEALALKRLAAQCVIAES